MTIPRLVLAALAASLVASAAVAQANWPTGGQRGLARLTVPPAAGGEVAPRPPPSEVKAPLPPAAPKTLALAPAAAAGPAAAGLAAGGLALGAPIGLLAVGAAAAALVSGASTSTTGTR
jgi:hypothetical protein